MHTNHHHQPYPLLLHLPSNPPCRLCHPKLNLLSNDCCRMNFKLVVTKGYVITVTN
ncbi:hypothetical protein A2U01_0085709, partial [Trifolium medium]|nr:hypothetical protein [Trifolium medium]